MGSILSFQCRDTVRKFACIFAGIGHLQPLLLATTNTNYLLDRFCMERCCSSEYISRIVTSIIFMEILSIIVVRLVLIMAGTGLRTVMKIEGWSIWKTLKIPTDPTWSDSNAQQLVNNSKNEEWVRDPISVGILWAIMLGYFQILVAFIYGGKKGHMHWFYLSLMFQHFLNSLIAGSIGFWDVGLALWYLVTLPMAPIVVFFYQLMIHSWIRNHGPRDAEYIVVEYQIWLAISISCIATALWTAGYAIPPKTAQLNLTTGFPGTHITKTPSTPASRTLRVYSTKSATAGTTKSLTIKSTTTFNVEVKVYSITVTLTGGIPTPSHVIVYPNGKLKVGPATVESNQSATVTATVDQSEAKTVKVVIQQSGGDKKPLYEKAETRTVRSTVTNVTVKLALEHENTTNIEVKEGAGVPGQPETTDPGTPVTVTGYTCYPNYGHYINGTSAGNDNLWNENWDGGRCTFAEYYKSSNSPTPALLKLYIRDGNSKIRYYGTTNAQQASEWKKIANETLFKQYIKELVRTGSLTTLTTGYNTDQGKSPTSNIDYSKAFNWTVWFPLIMQGLSVGAVGSIFPNLIPKTLTCPKTTRNLSVVNMFIVTVPHIFNVMLGDMGSSWFAAHDWTDKSGGIGWPGSLLLYLFYILAILFAIFNIHYPE